MAEQIDTRGLYGKFDVTRTDGRSAPGEKHSGCQYFVLDLDHDEHADAALRAYAAAARDDRPVLASRLDAMTGPDVDPAAHDRQVAERAAAQALRDAADWITAYDLGGQEYRVETLLEDRADSLAPRPAAPGVSVSAEQVDAALEPIITDRTDPGDRARVVRAILVALGVTVTDGGA